VQGRNDQALRAFERAALADPTLPEVHPGPGPDPHRAEELEDARKEDLGQGQVDLGQGGIGQGRAERAQGLSLRPCTR